MLVCGVKHFDLRLTSTVRKDCDYEDGQGTKANLYFIAGVDLLSAF